MYCAPGLTWQRVNLLITYSQALVSGVVLEETDSNRYEMSLEVTYLA